MCQHVSVGWKEAMKWGWVRQAIRLPLWSPGQHFTLETKHHPLLWFEGWKFWFQVSIILIKLGSYDLDRKTEWPWYFWPFTLGNTVAQSQPHGNLPPASLPPSAGEHRGKRRLVHKELAHSSLLWHQRIHRPTPGLSRVLQPHLLPDTAAPPVAQRRHLKAHHFPEVWPLPADDTCFIFLISSSAYQPQRSLPYIFISPFIS